MIEIRHVDHIGIRVADLDRAVAFYGVLGFELVHKDPNDAVAILKNPDDVEINLVRGGPEKSDSGISGFEA